MSARFLTAYLATTALLVGVFAHAAAKPPQLPVKLQVDCAQVEEGGQDSDYSSPEPIYPQPPTPDKMPKRVYYATPTYTAQQAPVDPPPPVPAKTVVRVYQVADLVVPVDSTPVLQAGYPSQPKCCTPEAVQGYYPAPVDSDTAPAKFEPLPISGMFPPFGFLDEREAKPAKRKQVKRASQPAPHCPGACNGKNDGKDIQLHVQETPTGDLLFGYSVNSDAGLSGSVAVNERNFATARAKPEPMPAPAPCTPPCCAVIRTPRPQKTVEDQLIKLIVTMIKPESWSEMGGSGTIDYYPLGMALVINQTPEIQEQVAELLESLRRLQDVEVAVEVRFVTVPASFYGQVVNDLSLQLIQCQKETCVGPCPAACSKACCKDSPGEGLAFLNASQIAKFYDKIQGDPHTNVMQSPKMSMFNGQESTINIMDTQFFVTDVHFKWIGDQVICCPVNEPISTGLKMTIQPVVSADKRYVRLSWDASYTEVCSPVPLYPITSEITPTFEGGAKGQPETFTMFIQEPSLCRQNVHKTVSIPDGGTVLLPAWSTCHEVPEEVQTPIWSQLPYVGRLFKQVGYHKETMTTVMLVTPRILCNSERETAKVAESEMGPTVVENLQKLERAHRLFKKAEQCSRRGEVEHAARCYEAVRQLCPGSRIAQLAARRCQQLHTAESAARVDSVGRTILAANSRIGMKPMFLVVGSPEPEIFHKGTGELFITEGLVNQCKTDGELAALLYHELGKMISERETEATPEPCPNASAVLAPSAANYHHEAADLLGKYYQACAEGHLAEATQWAIKALAIDPACFSKEKDKNASHPALNAN